MGAAGLDVPTLAAFPGALPLEAPVEYSRRTVGMS